MAEWIEKSLGEIAEVTKLAGFEFTKYIKYIDNGEIIALRALNLRNGELDLSDIKRISRKVSEGLTRSKIYKDDILLTYTGNGYGDCAIIEENDKYHLAPNICKIIPNQNVIYPYYLYCYIRSKAFYNQMSNNMTGSGQPTIPMKTIRLLKIPVPDMSVQVKIANIIRSLNQKIRNNKVINNNLLEQIKAICTAWLSEYKPFDGIMPSDWVETPLSDMAEFISGYSYKGTELTDSTIAMATIKNFDRKGGFKLDGYKEIIPSSKLKESQHAELFDTLVAHTDLTQNAEVIGNAEPVMSKSGYDDIVFSMDLVKVLPKKDGVSKFLIAAILQDKKFKAHCLGYVNGTTVLHLSKKALPEYKLFLPSDFSTLKPLDEVVTALYKQVSSNISENTYLEELRESLLPKLMSGELDVSDIEI